MTETANNPTHVETAIKDLEALLDSEDIHVSSDVGDYLQPIIDLLHMAPKPPSGFAVIYDEYDPVAEDWFDNVYQPFDTAEQATTMFLDMVGDNAAEYRAPRIVHIDNPITAPKGQDWGE